MEGSVWYVNIQWKPLNLNNLAQIETDSINRVITLTDFPFH